MNKNLDLTLTPKTKKLLIIVAGLVVFLLCYLLGYNRLMEKKDAVDSEITSLRPTLQEYQGYAEKEPEYKAKIVADKEYIEDTMNRLPSDVLPEDTILYVTQNFEDKVQADASDISFSDPTLVNSFSGVTADNVDEPSSAQKMNAYQTQSTVTLKLDYPKLKQLLDTIYAPDADITGLDSITVSFDAESAGLNGSLVMNQYYLTYDGVAPHVTNLPPMNYGLTDLFGTLES